MQIPDSVKFIGGIILLNFRVIAIVVATVALLGSFAVILVISDQGQPNAESPPFIDSTPIMDVDGPTLEEHVETSSLSDAVPAVDESVPSTVEVNLVPPEIDVDILSCQTPVELFTVNLSYEHETPVREIISDIAQQWGLNLASLDLVPAHSTRIGWSETYTPQQALDELRKGSEWNWFRDDETLQIVRHDSLLPTHRVLSSDFQIIASAVEGGLRLSVNSDLDDHQAIEVRVIREYFRRDRDRPIAAEYATLCGLAPQWRVPKYIPINDQQWKANVEAIQDERSVAGKPFEIIYIADSVTVTASAFGQPTVENSIELPLTVDVSAKSDLIGANQLRLWESYRLREKTPITEISPDLTLSERFAPIGTKFRVEFIDERATGSKNYLITESGRKGWISSRALMAEGVDRVSEITRQEQSKLTLYKTVLEKVFRPCADQWENGLVEPLDWRSSLAKSESMHQGIMNMLPKMVEVQALIQDMRTISRVSAAQADVEFNGLYRVLLEECKSISKL